MSRLLGSTVAKLVSSVPYSISYTGLPLGSLGGSQLSSKPSERLQVTDSSRGTEGAVHGGMDCNSLQHVRSTRTSLMYYVCMSLMYAGNFLTCVKQ